MTYSTYSTYTVATEQKSKQVASMLIAESIFFQVMPLPDDEWEFAVKPEAFSQLTRIILQARAGVGRRSK